MINKGNIRKVTQRIRFNRDFDVDKIFSKPPKIKTISKPSFKGKSRIFRDSVLDNLWD